MYVQRSIITRLTLLLLLLLTFIEFTLALVMHFDHDEYVHARFTVSLFSQLGYFVHHMLAQEFMFHRILLSAGLFPKQHFLSIHFFVRLINVVVPETWQGFSLQMTLFLHRFRISM